MRLIDGDALIEKIRTLQNAGIHWYISAEAVFKAILDAPNLEPVRKIGSWRLVTPDSYSFSGYRCSECNELVYGKTNFCCNCGADMRSKND